MLLFSFISGIGMKTRTRRYFLTEEKAALNAGILLHKKRLYSYNMWVKMTHSYGV